MSSDEEYAHCTREEKAGPLTLDERSETYAHRLVGDCLCGNRHISQPPSPQPSNGNSSRRIVDTRDYTDEDGQLLFQTVRYEPKDFTQRRPDGKGGWIWNIQGVRRVLYRLPELIAANPAKPVFIGEGEKDVDRLWDTELVATTNPMGAKKWSPEYSGYLEGRHVVVIPDNDGAGQGHAAQIAKSLYGIAKSVRVVDLPGLPDAGDVSDWLDEGHTAEELVDLARNAPEWEPSEAEGAEDATNEGPRVVRLGDVEPESVTWSWNGYIARGKVTLIAGDPGLGKSWATLDLAARVTVGGETPDRQHKMEQGAVVLLTAEDGLADTVRPRIDVQGGDASLVHVLEGIVDADGHERLPSLVEDIAILEQLVMSTKAHLVIVDPLNAYIGRTDSHNDAQIRRALTPLAKMAERTGAAVLVVMHLNQATLQPALYRIQGSIGYVGAARSVLLVVRDKDNPDLRVIAPIKSNLAAAMPAVAFTITEEPALAWKGTVEVDIAELLAVAAPEEHGAREEAKTFLKEVLADGNVPQKDIFKEAREFGISDATLRRAAKDMGIDAARIGKAGKEGGGHWVWNLPSGLDDQDALCDQGKHLNPKEDVKVLTPNGSVGTNQVKVLTENPQTTLIPGVAPGEHLNIPNGDEDGEVRV